MADALIRLRPVFGPEWPGFLRQFGADLRAQRDALVRRADPATVRAAVHVVVALAGTAGEQALVEAARLFLSGGASGVADVLAGIETLLLRIDDLARGAMA